MYSRKRIAKLIYDELIPRGYAQIISEATHWQKGRWSQIDLLFTNRPEKISAGAQK